MKPGNVIKDSKCQIPFAPQNDSGDEKIAEMFATGIIDEGYCKQFALETLGECVNSQTLNVFEEAVKIYGTEVGERIIMERGEKFLRTVISYIFLHQKEKSIS